MTEPPGDCQHVDPRRYQSTRVRVPQRMERDLRELPPLDGVAPGVAQSVWRPKGERLARRAGKDIIGVCRPPEPELQPEGTLSPPMLAETFGSHLRQRDRSAPVR